MEPIQLNHTVLYFYYMAQPVSILAQHMTKCKLKNGKQWVVRNG